MHTRPGPRWASHAGRPQARHDVIVGREQMWQRAATAMVTKWTSTAKRVPLPG